MKWLQSQPQDSKIHSPSRFILLGKLRRGLCALLVGLFVAALGRLEWNLWHYHDGNSNASNNFNLTVVVPGFGDMSRMPVLKESLHAIQASLQRKGYGFDCLVYVYKEDSEFLRKASFELSFCTVNYNPGLWTHHMKKVPPLTTTSHVAVLMDDIDVATHGLDTAYMMDRMVVRNYNILSSSFPRGTVHREGLHQRSNCISHETGYVDILFTVFDAATWNCWQDQIDLQQNSYGWGYDVLVADVCHAKIGVMDHSGVAVHVTHPCEKAGGCRKSSYDTNTARREMEEWIRHASTRHTLVGYPTTNSISSSNSNVGTTTTETKGSTMDETQAAYTYRSQVLERWKNYPPCD